MSRSRSTFILFPFSAMAAAVNLVCLKRVVRAGFFCFMLVLLSHPQVQGNESDETGFDLEMDEMLLFDEIPSVFSASKYEQKVTEAPSSISIVTADEIKKYGYRDFAEILQSIRGFLVTNDRNYKYLGIRGFGQPSDYSNRVLVLINGRRTNDNIYDAPAIDNQFSLNIDLIERVEVVRGPSSSLYGNSAFFGVINVITKRGRDYDGWETSLEYGSYNTFQPSMTYGKKLSNGVEIIVSGSFYESDGDDDLDYNETFNSPQKFYADPGYENVRDWHWWNVDAYQGGSATAKDLDHDRNKKLFAMFSLKDFTLTGEYYHRNKAIPTAPWETIFGDKRQYTVDEGYSVDLEYNHFFDNQLNLSGRINYSYYNYYGDYPYEDWDAVEDPAFAGPETVINDDRAKGKWLYGEVQLSKLLLEKHKMTGGVNFQHNIKQEQFSSYPVKPGNWGYAVTDFYDDRDTFNWAMFLQDDFAVTENFIINAGVRYDYFEEHGDTTNPRVALIYNPWEKHTFKMVYGEAFRAPNVYELYYNDSGNTQKAPTDLESEAIRTYELIYELYHSDNTRFTAVGFYYEIDNLISLVTDPVDDLLVFENSADIEAQGLELEIETKLDNGISGRLSYAFQETEDKGTGRELTNSPEHLVKLNLTIPLKQDKIFLGFEEIYVSKRRTYFLEKEEAIPAADRLPGYPSDYWSKEYFLTNVTLHCKKLWKDLDASASIYNLFDEDYGDPGGVEHFQKEIEQNGITFRVKLTYLF